MINAIKFSIEEIEASDQYFDHTGIEAADFVRAPPNFNSTVIKNLFCFLKCGSIIRQFIDCGRPRNAAFFFENVKSIYGHGASPGRKSNGKRHCVCLTRKSR